MRQLLLVIGRAADIRMARARRGSLGGVEREAIEAVFEHGLDVAILAGPGRDGPPARAFDALGAVLLHELK